MFVELNWLPLASRIKFKSLMLAYKGSCHDSVTPVIKGLSSSSAYAMLKTIQTLFVCHSTMVELPNEGDL